MTVEELIALLQEFPGDAEVQMSVGARDGDTLPDWIDIEKLEIVANPPLVLICEDGV